MATIRIGAKVPAFTALATGKGKLRLSELKGNHVVLYFYPRDNTPGCTQEGCEFRDAFAKFRSRNAMIIGVSRDSLESHGKFADKYAFPFMLIADEDEKLCTLFDVIKMKNMYGRQVRGIERSTFLIDEKGVLRREWRKVKLKGHVQEVLKALSDICSTDG